MNTTTGLKRSQPAKYEIKIQGRQNEIWSDWLDNLEIEVDQKIEGTTTTLTGVVQDQSGLHGILNRIRDLSIPLISVQLIKALKIEKE